MFEYLRHASGYYKGLGCYLQNEPTTPIITHQHSTSLYLTKESGQMPKRFKDLRVPASLIRAWIDVGRIEVLPKVGVKLLQLVTPIYLTFPQVYDRKRRRKNRRMWVPAGSFLNSRWIPLGPRNSEWKLVTSLREQELKERYIIVRVEEEGRVRWYRLIYEIVSSQSQLLRQRVHIRAQHAREKRRKVLILEAVERELGDYLLGRTQLSRSQLDELSTLQYRLSNRLFGSMANVRARLSARDTVAFLNAWMSVEGLLDHRRRFAFLANGHDSELQRHNVEAHILSRYDRLAVYISPEIRRTVRWSRYHVQRAATAVQEKRIPICKRHLRRAVYHLDQALKTLWEWPKKLSEDEREYIPKL
ncbi:MAG: hypothetical protein A2Z11_02690 [Candidatus Woykebacteria bacterium RBG_16_43_9]|uniref:Uncharacterized protein n=1 Tax=Candidatus Woykebacteria bacterium RBG_16_43_9 TaxID=1802596 RepID=A0A1G1WH56_9BACT|nr:MAG: hypothetical protein A2Z11_02690 [Candidatus Woykebacteria bacterium RBG_16_43_9]